MKKLLGLVGYPLSHSFSASYFQNKFLTEGISDEFEYLNFEIENINSLQEILKTYPDLVGLNVTIPHKLSVIPLVNSHSDEAKEIGAVNTLTIKRNGGITIYGDNTDWIGFKNSLIQLIGEDRPKALILGTGGSSKAIRLVMKQLGIEYRSVSRNPDEMGQLFGYKDLNHDTIDQHKLIVNTTPVGMYPNNSKSPEIPYEAIGKDHYLFDLIYNPEKTRFLVYGEQQGAHVKNGLDMLKIQAEASWEIWKASLD